MVYFDEVWLYCGELWLYCCDVCLYCGDVCLYCGDADCFMIHIPSALEDQIRATIVNRRHLNNRFRVEDNHWIKLDGGADNS